MVAWRRGRIDFEVCSASSDCGGVGFGAVVRVRGRRESRASAQALGRVGRPEGRAHGAAVCWAFDEADWDVRRERTCRARERDIWAVRPGKDE